MFLEQQIRILEGFLRDHVTEVMAAKNSALQNSCFNRIIIDNITVYIAFLSISDFFQKHWKILMSPRWYLIISLICTNITINSTVYLYKYLIILKMPETLFWLMAQIVKLIWIDARQEMIAKVI